MSTPTKTSSARPRRAGGKILPEHARAHNRALVLQSLFSDGAMSRADLSRETGLTRVTISDLVAGLIADGYVVERGVREASGPGKPAILVDIARAGHRIAGLDLSGSDRFVGAVLTLDGEIVARHEVDVPADPAGILPAVIDLARAVIADAHAPVLGLGVGTPGVVDDRGVVLAAPGLGWSDLDLSGRLEAELGLPVLVANDANAAVLAEHTFGGAGDDVILIRVGRGVGAGLLTGGEPLAGARFAAGEIGHVTVGTDGGPRCACGKIGCLEAWLAVPSLTERLATSDDPTGVLRDAGERLGIALAPIVGALDLSEITLSGPSDLLGGALAEAAAETVRTRTLATFHDGLQVRMSAQSEDIVLRGAAVMVLSGRLGVS
ncbi:ROK family transcriptional regulator [Microbacterium sp. EYE_5]|uniref:ROK family transcriptional regulator n=1 Tax=unclassified Microbacterium TaxID=2609290 RepID=UPI00200310EB|nr:MULTISPECIES: ROK family transcriptional regulator [unclassified Microbacterium]MCK6081641.1 ROK family transcriptional regulator [Microbacterium sp. EYE_382]MCK6086911.1 ROK family transcriptional regulator [Microbacterium sp. EYE_384]MCK6123591.1 ROK family transcriptional regulator [Microbacterium sp. EYE_80]MCK6126500.1 ROK family transcriptional regulator [Microbacterium sp. EYE_79]MCK6142595.1 ROK family transcriptional regulator [Microbacterium sp. EYE_39]